MVISISKHSKNEKKKHLDNKQALNYTAKKSQSLFNI